mmetsp:Transcript_33236/g.60215  ORF Transcript_33236/g.60215 Transcript_33236/m.60215 type:complete len:391 (-) Transcript_33236:657-1829(-)
MTPSKTQLSDVQTMVTVTSKHIPVVVRSSICQQLPCFWLVLAMRDLPILEVALLHNTLPDEDTVVLQLWSRNIFILILFVILIIFLIFSPLDTPGHQLLVSLDCSWTTLYHHDVCHLWHRDTGPCEVELLGVHIYLEEMPLVLQVLDLEDKHLGDRLVLSHPLLLLLLFTLLSWQPSRLVSLLVLLSTLLNLLPHLPLDSGGIGDGLIAKHSHQVGHLHLRRRRLQDTHLNLVTDLLSSLLALQTAKLLSLLGSQVHHCSFRSLLLRCDLDRNRVLHVWSDLVYIHLRICPLLTILILLEERQVPPLDVRNWLSPDHFRLDLLHRLLLLLLGFLLRLLLLFFLLFLLLLLVNAQCLLLDLLHKLLLSLHQISLFNKPETSALPTVSRSSF